jgi:DNA-binding beta-propeller fold protein YncE
VPLPLRRHLSILLVASLFAACGANTAEPPATSSVVPITAAPPVTVGSSSSASTATTDGTPEPTTTAATLPTTTLPKIPTFPGMPAVIDPDNLYSEAVAGKMSPNVQGALEYVYVPSNDDGSITVIDQKTFEIVDTYRTGGKLVQHVVPGWDMKMLYANVSGGNYLMEIDPFTGKPGNTIGVPAPYNLYWTPDGTKAIVMAERVDQINLYDLTTGWTQLKSTKVPCKSQMKSMSFGGVNHADWSIDGKFFLATCEFAGDMLKIDTETMEVVDQIKLSKTAMPQDVRITPDGKKFYVADMQSGGIWIVDAGQNVEDKMQILGRIETGKGAHGMYPSRDGKYFYVANRGHLASETGRRSRPGEGSVSVIDWRTDQVVDTWEVPNGGSPDMGGVSADGKTLWLSGRYDSEVYAFNTDTGELRARIKVTTGPHGLSVFPQPGRYTLGHTGNYR